MLTKNSTTVDSVDVILNASQDFSVDPNMDPWADDGNPLSLGDPPPTVAKTRAFTIVNCQRYMLVFRIGKLTMDNAAIAAWHANFNGRRAIVLPMRLANGTSGPNLIFDSFCTEHSSHAIMAPSVQRAAQAVAFVALALVNFAIAVVTLRIFKQPKSSASIAAAGHPDGDASRGKETARLA
jgi:hypothetical protein